MAIYRNKKIAKYIHENLTCCISGAPLPDPHHIKGEGYGTVKAPDYMQIPLAHHLHNELHDNGYKDFEKKYGRTQRRMVAETAAKLHADGVINLNYIYLEFDMPEWLYEEMENINV